MDPFQPLRFTSCQQVFSSLAALESEQGLTSGVLPSVILQRSDFGTRHTFRY